MSLLFIYVLLSFITACTAVVAMFYPVLKTALDTKIVNTFTRNPWVSAAVFFGIAMLVAPAFLFALFHTPTEKQITEGLSKVMLEPSVK